MMTATSEEILRAAVDERSHRYSLATTLDGIRYSNEFHLKGRQHYQKALFVGVGHGLDAIAALVDERLDQAVGVDPFISDHGNDDRAYNRLLDLISRLGLEKRFIVNRMSIQEFCSGTDDSFDLITMNDTLHHIIETRESLRKSSLFPKAVELCRSLLPVAAGDGRLIISDVSRHGVRPILNRVGITKVSVDYSSKQNWRQWHAAISAAGWQLERIENYLPFRIGSWAKAVPSGLARYTICDRYCLVYSN